MDIELQAILQQRIDKVNSHHIKNLQKFPEVPEDFIPWECGLSPSELYSRSLPLRKKMGMEVKEQRWVSIKRWLPSTPGGINLPEGVFYSIKRHEQFMPSPYPHFEQVEYVLIMFPYGNVWSQIDPDVPITEEWLMSNDDNQQLILEKLLRQDSYKPIKGYWKAVYDQYLTEKAKEDSGKPTLLWIHMKRKRAAEQRQAAKLTAANKQP